MRGRPRKLARHSKCSSSEAAPNVGVLWWCTGIGHSFRNGRRSPLGLSALSRPQRSENSGSHNHIGHTAQRPCGDYSACIFERGPHTVRVSTADPVFKQLPKEFRVMESHCGQIEWPPAGWTLIATAAEGTTKQEFNACDWTVRPSTPHSSTLKCRAPRRSQNRSWRIS